MEESLGGLKQVKVHVRLQSLCLGNIIGSYAFEHKPRVGLSGGAAARVQQVYGVAKLTPSFHVSRLNLNYSFPLYGPRPCPRLKLRGGKNGIKKE